MIRPMNPRESRIAAILLLFVILALLAVAVYLPLRAKHRHYDDAIESLLDRQARYHRIASSRPDIEAAIEALGKLDTRKYYLTNRGPALAAAEIQQIVQTLVEANGLRMESMQVAPHKDEDGRRRIVVNFQLAGAIAPMQRVLHALETTEPYLFVENLMIRAMVPRNYKPQPLVEPEITAQFDLSGYAMVRP